MIITSRIKQKLGVSLANHTGVWCHKIVVRDKLKSKGVMSREQGLLKIIKGGVQCPFSMKRSAF